MAVINVCTFNLRFDHAPDGINSFTNRRAFIRENFPKHNVDLIGFQEVLPHMRDWLIETFPEYEICGMGRNEDLRGESNVIAFRRSKFDLVSLNTFWLSDTPTKPGSFFSTDQSTNPRICTYVTLYHKETKKLLRFYNTHLDNNLKEDIKKGYKLAQAQGISLILAKISADYQVSPLPVILTGDFNAGPNSYVVSSVKAFNGCGNNLVDVTEKFTMTFHGFNPQNAPKCKIDYIFTNLPCDAEKSVLLTDNENGVYLSDHYPICAYLEI